MKNRPETSLIIDKAQLKEAKSLRNQSISNAVSLEKGKNQENMILHVVWSDGKYEVGLGKPGKEAKESRTNINPNDMWPFVRAKSGQYVVESATFKNVFKELEHMHAKSKYALELLACLLARSALMLDHEMVDGKVAYNPPKDVIDEIKKDIPTAYKISLEAFMHYLDAIALNEDVKYKTKGDLRGKPYGNQAGRPNNLMTCAHLIAVLLGRAELVDFAYGFSTMRGVSGLSLGRAKKYFPMLAGEEKEEE